MKSILQLLFITFLLVPVSFFSQGEGENWYFGYNAGIDFTGTTPAAVTNGAINQWEGVATISDASGNLLFYTNGQNVWDATHSIMLNGSGLLGHNSSSQSAVIVPYPYYPDRYYVFTVDQLAGSNGLRYSIVDMSLNGGLGGVTATKNVLLFSNSTEKITAVRHANNSDIWVIAHEWGTNNFRSYLVDACNGLNTTPVISSTGTTHNHQTSNGSGGWWSTGAIGYLKASPQGDKLGLAHFTQASTSAAHFELFDFNNSTGAVSNPISLPNPSTTSLPPGAYYYAAYGVEFSPDGTFFYGGLNATGEIFQYDLLAGSNAAIASSATLVGTSTGPNLNKIGALQLATDGKIYVARDGVSYLGTLTNPNAFGVNYTANGIALAGQNSGLGLPTFIQSFFLDLPDIYIGYSGDDCQGNAISFALQGTDVGLVTAVDWDYGDGSTLTGASGGSVVNHTYSTSGSMYVQATYYFNCYYVVLGGYITVNSLPNATANSSGAYCDNASNFTLSGSPSGGVWSGTGVSGSTYSPSNAGAGTHTLNYTYTNSNGCADTDATTITVNASPTANAGTGGSVNCTTPSLSLNGTGGGNYSWSPSGSLSNAGISSPSASPTTNTTYTLVVTNGSGCSDSDQVTVSADKTSPSANAGANFTINCSNPTATINGAGTGSYSWSTPDGNITSGNTTLSPSIDAGGTYQLTVQSSNGCTDTDAVTVAESFGAPTANIAAAGLINCANPNLQINASSSTNSTGGSTGLTYSWSASSGGNIVSGGSTATPTVNSAGTYTVVVTGSNGCTDSESVSVAADSSVPVANIASAADITCVNSSVVLDGSASVGAGLNYYWTNAAGNAVSGSSITSPTVTVNTAGVYTLEVVATNGCSNTSNITINQNTNLPVIIIAPPATIDCQNQTVTIDASGSDQGTNFTYQWTTSTGNIVSGATSLNPIVDEAGSYTLTITNSISGCVNSSTLPVTGDWGILDCDGDGVDNDTEIADGTLPYDPCDFDAGSITLPTGGDWNSADCDGDGVTNETEVTDGTLPYDPCDFETVSITLPTGGDWNTADCDGDGVTNETEVLDGTLPYDPCDYDSTSITITQGGDWNTADCDGDGVINETEVLDGTDPFDPCDYVLTSQSVAPSLDWENLDCDGDGVTNGDELADGTDPADPCSFEESSITLPTTVDCNIGVEVVIPNVFTPNGDGTNDTFTPYLENVKAIKGVIYNRWGQLMFEWDDLDVHWDGKTLKGNDAPEGTYFYLLDVDDFEDNKYQFEGHFVLRR